MEQQQEKKIKVLYRSRRRTQWKSTWFLPLDLIYDILLKLPAKSLARFGCVSKLWSSIIKDPHFIDSFETLSSTRPSLLVCSKKRDTLCVFSIPQHHRNPNESYTYSHHIDRRFPKYSPFSVMEDSVHGLICFEESEKPVLWNPSMRRFLTLSRPRKSWMHIKVFLGYDPIEGKHKVLCLPRKRGSDKCRVLTFGSGPKSWRTVETNHRHRSDMCRSGKCINGILYYLAYLKLSPHYVIMSFDVRSEKFDIIEKPSNIHWNEMVSYEGRLAFVGGNNTNNGIRLLILEDAEKHEWSCKDFHVPIFHRDPSSARLSYLRGTTPAGEFVYVANRYDQPFSTFLYDPEKNSFRKLEHEGIEDEGNDLYIFPNHIESLRSL